jgi:hypothetical protein
MLGLSSTLLFLIVFSIKFSMMKNFFFSVIFLSLFVFSVSGQVKSTITGSLYEPGTSNVPIEQATVRLLSLPDSSLVMGTTSGKNGSFTLSGITKGNYLIQASYIGFLHLYRKVTISGTPPTVSLGKLYFEENAVFLKEAVVEGKASEIVVKNDTIEYNAASYKTEENAVVEDLLKKLPGVEVDTDGKITIGGKEIKKILVDGKEFISDDPKVASKNLPVNMIEKLQVLDQKSDMSRMTGFDDGEEQAVINLSIKPGMKKGTIINAAVGAGHDTKISTGDFRYEAAGMVNQMNNDDRYSLVFNGNNTNNMGASDMGGNRFGGMRGMRRGAGSGITTSETFAFDMNKEFDKKLFLNGGVTYNGSNREVERKTNRNTTYMDKGSNELKSLIENTERNIHDQSDDIGFNFRLEWKPNENNTFIFRPNYAYNVSRSEEHQRFSSLEGFATTDSVSQGESNARSEGNGHNLGGTLEYAHQFSKKGRVFSVSVSGSYNESYSQEIYDWNRHYYKENGGAGKDSLVSQRSENDNVTNSFRLYTSYVEPLGNNYFLQLAYRYNQSNTENLNSTYDIDAVANEATLNPLQSRSTVRESADQRFSLNLKSMRDKYNYTIGFNIDPAVSTNGTYQPTVWHSLTDLPDGFAGRLPNNLGDSIVSTIPRDIINFSPTVNFNYIFGQRTNLRIDYSGSTTQPSASQLRDYEDYSNPQNTVRGNPELKSGYRHSLSTNFDKFVPETQLFYTLRLRGNMSFNDVGSKTTIDSESGRRLTEYDNINGNWDVNIMGMGNAPLRNKKFSVNTFLSASYNNRRSYTNNVLNTMNTLNIRDRMGINYRSDLFDVGLGGSLNYSNSLNELVPDKNMQTYDFGMTGNTTWYLPFNWSVNSDISWNGKRGYSDGFNKEETIWNASVTKQLFNKKIGTGSIRLKIYDILQDRKSINRSVGDNYIEDSESNILQSFFMCSFIYRINIFPGGGSATERDFDPEREFRRNRDRNGGGGRGGRM